MVLSSMGSHDDIERLRATRRPDARRRKEAAGDAGGLDLCGGLLRGDGFPAVTRVDDHHQVHRMPAPTVRASDARTVSAQESLARVLFTIDPLRAKS
jgi:hypothetical protein